MIQYFEYGLFYHILMYNMKYFIIIWWSEDYFTLWLSSVRLIINGFKMIYLS